VRYVDGIAVKNYGKGWWATLYQRISYSCISDYCENHGIELVYVRSFMNASPFNIHLFQQLQKDGVKAVMEIPTYPYDREFDSLPLKYRLEHIADKLFRRRLASYMNAIVTFSDEEEIFGQRTIRISNGVDFDSIPLHQSSAISHQSSELHLIGVAEVHYWHGFDRLIAGIGEYYKNGGKRDVFFHIVGGVGPSEMYDSMHAPGFAELIEKYHIKDKVVFHGQLFGEELTKVFNLCQFAIGSLGRHRCGITVIKTLKNREYATRGIPFIYSEQDSDFDHQPYVLKAPADESPIDIQQIIDFVDHFTMKPENIRKTVEHLKWEIQMQRVLDAVFDVS
jgi:glycosyltransferase involved in cell wall biosynthesis